MSNYTGAAGLAYYAPSFNGLIEPNSRTLKQRERSSSILRNQSNYNQQSYIHQMADSNRRSTLVKHLRSEDDSAAEFMFKDSVDETPKKASDKNVMPYENSVNIQIAHEQTTKYLEGGMNQWKKQSPLKMLEISRAKSQGTTRRKTPQTLGDMIKMPRRML